MMLAHKVPFWRNTFLATLLVFGSLSLAVLSTSAQSSPEDVARALIAAEASNDAGAAAATFAEDAVVTLPTGVFDTPEAIRGWQDELAAENFHIEAVNIEANDNTVSWTGTISLDRFRD